MARRVLKAFGAALIFTAGWKAKEKRDEMFAAPKPAKNILAKLAQFRDGVFAGSGDGGATATEKKKKKNKPETSPKAVAVEESVLRREVDRIKEELYKEVREEMRQGRLQIAAAVAEELMKSRDDAVRPVVDHHHQHQHQRDDGFIRVQ